MISKKAKGHPGEDEELQSLIDRMDSENAALNKILNCIQPGSSTRNEAKKSKDSEAKSKSKSI